MNWRRRSCKEREHGSLDTRQTATSVCKRLQKGETLIWSTHRKKALYLSHPFKIFIQVSLFPECIKAILPILLYGVSLSHKIIIAGLQSVFCLNPRDLQHCWSKGSNLGCQNSCGHKNSFSSFRLICSLNFFSNTYFLCTYHRCWKRLLSNFKSWCTTTTCRFTNPFELSNKFCFSFNIQGRYIIIAQSKKVLLLLASFWKISNADKMSGCFFTR